IGLKRRLKTKAKRMGLRIGAARRIPTSTTTVAARPSITRKMEGWRSAVVMVSPMPDLASTGLFEDSFMDPASELRLALLPNSVHRLFKLACVVPSPADAAVFPPWFAIFRGSPTSFPSNRRPRLPHSDVVGDDEDATAGSLTSFASCFVRR